MDRKKTLERVDRYIIATIGMFLSALGIAMTIISNLGTQPLSCPSYVLNLRWTNISVGTFTLIVNCFYILLQLVLLRRKFKWEYLMQIVASAIFGYMIDFCLAKLDWIVPKTMFDRYGLTVAACLISAFGVSLEVKANAWMLSAEMTSFALSEAFGKKFSDMKIAMDCTVVVLSALASLLFFHNVLGDGTNNVIGFGTLICAVFIGLCMKLTDPLVDKLLAIPGYTTKENAD